jgi:phenol 2-monooxygenase (NADPH)
LDTDFSTCISGHIPEKHHGRSTNPDELLFKLFDDSMKFNLGLGIDFASNVLNVEPLTGTIKAGKRGPDCLLRAPGSQFPLRLFQLTKNMGAFFILIFAGQPLVTSSDIRSLREIIDRSRLLETLPKALYRILTIISGNAMNPDAVLGTKRFGDAYYDVDSSAHEKYGISINCGGIVVLRPDGILGTAANLNDWESIVRYFSAFMIT